MPLKDLLPKELIEAPALKNLIEKEPADLAKSYLEMTALQGKSMQIPSGPDDVEGWARAYDRLGHPKEAKDYGDLENDFQKRIAEKAAKHRIPASALKDLIAETKAAEGEVRAAQESALAKDWGQDFEKNRELARRGTERMDAATRSAYEELAKYNPAAASKLAFAVGKAAANDTPSNPHLPPAITPQAAALRYKQLREKVAQKDILAIQESKDLLGYLEKNNALHLA